MNERKMSPDVPNAIAMKYRHTDLFYVPARKMKVQTNTLAFIMSISL